MWSYGNPNAVNQALGKTGSQFRVDENGMVPNTPPPVAPPAMDVQAPVVQQPTLPAPQPPVQATPATASAAATTAEHANQTSKEGLGKIQDYASKVKELDAAKEAGDDNMARVGTLIGSVLSFWGGDYMGGVQGIQSVGKMGS